MKSRPVYVGTLEAVRVAPDDERDVAPVVLGIVPGVGLVTAASRSALSEGRLSRRPADRAAVAWPCEAVYYRRRRAEGSRWVHETPGAYCWFPVFDSRNPPSVYLESPASVRCDGPGDYICEVGQ